VNQHLSTNSLLHPAVLATVQPTDSHSDEIRQQLIAARTQAEVLAASLAAQLQAKQQGGWARADGRPDVFRQVTGQSSLESAVAEARRVIEQYDRLVAQLPGNTPSNDSVRDLEPVVLRGSFRVGPATIARTSRAI